ncbi:MAG: hypothetical protein HOE53_00450 [Candidatus Magasanikbacteria bacterium]|nr:hypothetical protein [Candidatus Magasanikbacteria bacterium]
MSERATDIMETGDMCSHKNFPSTCLHCKKEQTKLEPTETRDGLPVIKAVLYERLYNTDIRAAGEDSSSTFNFQGFVDEDREDYHPGVAYRDSLATNGILKEAGQHDGIHVGTDGIIGYSADNTRMQSPADIGEYNIYITIPGKLQKEKGVFCRYDSCFRVETFDEDPENLEDIHDSKKGWIVMRLGLDPKEDLLARRKVEFIHAQIVRFVEEGGDLSEIKVRTRALENVLIDLDETDLQAKMKSLEDKK